jgi:hypothetical protein
LFTPAPATRTIQVRTRRPKPQKPGTARQEPERSEPFSLAISGTDSRQAQAGRSQPSEVHTDGRKAAAQPIKTVTVTAMTMTMTMTMTTLATVTFIEDGRGLTGQVSTLRPFSLPFPLPSEAGNPPPTHPLLHLLRSDTHYPSLLLTTSLPPL